MTKKQVRQKAKELEIPVAQKPDSQGICFIGPVSIRSFLQSLGLKEQEGDMVMKVKNQTVKGKSTSRKIKVDNENVIQVGQHSGSWFYTVGQRVGIELSNKKETWVSSFGKSTF